MDVLNYKNAFVVKCFRNQFCLDMEFPCALGSFVGFGPDEFIPMLEFNLLD